MGIQFHAGYILSGIRNRFLKKVDAFGRGDIFKQLSHFSLETEKLSTDNSDPIFVIVDNLISRGLPTLPSLLLEEAFAETFRLSKKTISEKTGEIDYIFTAPGDAIERLIENAFFTIDPRLNRQHQLLEPIVSWENHPGSEHEERFLYQNLPTILGDFSVQLLEPQREIASILRHPYSQRQTFDRRLGGLRSEFYRQKADFTVQFPASGDHKNGLVIEIDGSHHRLESQHILDRRRDEAIRSAGWENTVRIETSELGRIPESKISALRKFFTHPHAARLKYNYHNPLYQQPSGLVALQMALSPLGTARIQKTLTRFILAGKLRLDQEKWRIAVIERDVPCAHLAILDYQQMLRNLFNLEKRNRRLPKIELRVYHTEEFRNCELNAVVRKELYSRAVQEFQADLLIDISMLQRPGFTEPEEFFLEKVRAEHIAVIRSVYAPVEPRKIRCAPPPEFHISNDEQPEPLLYFLQNIFRKKEFREGQVKILRRILAHQDVIALLPTGAGKSLTYQLAALLQPGVVLIVDPLKSLMRDQHENLVNMGIDATVFINSSLGAWRRRDACEEMVQGRYQFVFISPERMQIREFRDYLKRMDAARLAFCVVDEAHCVSEWGHDFRTAYLRLGRNARKFCKTFSGVVPIAALTGTASFDVLSDVRRELDIDDEKAIITPKKFARDELQFEIRHIEKPAIPGEIDDFQIKEVVAGAKQNQLIRLIRDEICAGKVGEYFSIDSGYPNAGIVFCPHRKWVFGAQTISDSLRQTIPLLDGICDFYHGGNDEDEENLADFFEEVQRKFKYNELRLLAATKAFGMGIDKPNVRFTVHFNMPQSIESFYQEAGRAGRDRDKATCFILYSDLKLPTPVDGESVSVDKSLMLSFHKKAFQGIDKEKRIIYELLNEISFPFERGTERVNEIIESNLGLQVKVNLWLKEQQSRLYINGAEDKTSYGCINLRNQKLYPDGTIVTPEEARQILEDILDLIQEQARGEENLIAWLMQAQYQPPRPGIEKILATMNENDPPREVFIGFTNDKIKRISDYLVSKVDPDFSEKIVYKALDFAFTLEKFLEELRNELYKTTKTKAPKGKWIGFKPEDEKFIQSLFEKVRDQSDTFKAIYRLSVIGAIEDYEVDYNSKIITAWIRKLSDDEYIKNLQEYVAKYETPEEAKKVPDIITKRQRGDTILQRCCGYLVEFVYRRIAARRREAITVMESAILSPQFQEYVNSYFDSRYYPLLQPFLYDYTLDLAWKFIKDTKGEPDPVLHLRGACDRLLVENPDNAALLLMRSFCRFMIPGHSKQEASRDFWKAWGLFRKVKSINWQEVVAAISRFYRMAVAYDSRVAGYLDREIATLHTKWIKDYNRKKLEGIPHA